MELAAQPTAYAAGSHLSTAHGRAVAATVVDALASLLVPPCVLSRRQGSQHGYDLGAAAVTHAGSGAASDAAANATVPMVSPCTSGRPRAVKYGHDRKAAHSAAAGAQEHSDPDCLSQSSSSGSAGSGCEGTGAADNRCEAGVHSSDEPPPKRRRLPACSADGMYETTAAAAQAHEPPPALVATLQRHTFVRRRGARQVLDYYLMLSCSPGVFEALRMHAGLPRNGGGMDVVAAGQTHTVQLLPRGKTVRQCCGRIRAVAQLVHSLRASVDQQIVLTPLAGGTFSACLNTSGASTGQEMRMHRLPRWLWRLDAAALATGELGVVMDDACGMMRFGRCPGHVPEPPAAVTLRCYVPGALAGSVPAFRLSLNQSECAAAASPACDSAHPGAGAGPEGRAIRQASLTQLGPLLAALRAQPGDWLRLKARRDGRIAVGLASRRRSTKGASSDGDWSPVSSSTSEAEGSGSDADRAGGGSDSDGEQHSDGAGGPSTKLRQAAAAAGPSSGLRQGPAAGLSSGQHPAADADAATAGGPAPEVLASVVSSPSPGRRPIIACSVAEGQIMAAHAGLLSSCGCLALEHGQRRYSGVLTVHSARRSVITLVDDLLEAVGADVGQRLRLAPLPGGAYSVSVEADPVLLELRRLGPAGFLRQLTYSVTDQGLASLSMAQAKAMMRHVGFTRGEDCGALRCTVLQPPPFGHFQHDLSVTTHIAGKYKVTRLKAVLTALGAGPGDFLRLEPQPGGTFAASLWRPPAQQREQQERDGPAAGPLPQCAAAGVDSPAVLATAMAAPGSAPAAVPAEVVEAPAGQCCVHSKDVTAPVHPPAPQQPSQQPQQHSGGSTLRQPPCSDTGPGGPPAEPQALRGGSSATAAGGSSATAAGAAGVPCTQGGGSADRPRCGTAPLPASSLAPGMSWGRLRGLGGSAHGASAFAAALPPTAGGSAGAGAGLASGVRCAAAGGSLPAATRLAGLHTGAAAPSLRAGAGSAVHGASLHAGRLTGLRAGTGPAATAAPAAVGGGRGGGALGHAYKLEVLRQGSS